MPAKSTASSGAGYSEPEKTSETADYGSADKDSGGGTEAADENQKYIRTIDVLLKLESEDEYNSIVRDIKKKTSEYGGMVAGGSKDFDEIYSCAEITIKIPKDKTDDFMDSLEGEHEFKSISDNTEDVTLHYADVSARLQVKKEQRKKYMEYLDKAENTTELMEIEKELNDVIADIEAYQSEMNSLNGRIDYTTIDIKFSFNEPPAEELGFIDKLSASMKKLGRNTGDLFIFMMETAVYLAVVCLFFIPFTWIVVKACRFLFRGKRKKNSVPQDKEESLPDVEKAEEGIEESEGEEK